MKGQKVRAVRNSRAPNLSIQLVARSVHLYFPGLACQIMSYQGHKGNRPPVSPLHWIAKNEFDTFTFQRLEARNEETTSRNPRSEAGGTSLGTFCQFPGIGYFFFPTILCRHIIEDGHPCQTSQIAVNVACLTWLWCELATLTSLQTECYQYLGAQNYSSRGAISRLENRRSEIIPGLKTFQI